MIGQVENLAILILGGKQRRLIPDFGHIGPGGKRKY
jgi:hypothetical protein